jgi:hypothetical protein
MSGPISSLNPNAQNSCVDDGSEPNMSVAPPQNAVVPEPTRISSSAVAGSMETPSGTSGLVQKFPTPTSLKAAPPSTSTSPLLVTSAGVVPGGGSTRVAVSLFKQEIHTAPLEGTSVEVGTVSVQYGKDNDVQIVGARQTLKVSHGGYGLSLTGEVGVVRANLGENNDDGSVGGNIGAGAELIGGEATIDTPVGSLTGGLSESMSLSGSMGVRDADRDGDPEYCAKFSVPAFTLGACIERFW